MNFDEKINELINETEIPDCLSPKNIAIMLNQKTADKNIKLSASVISMKSKKKAIRFRSSAAVAACVALALGVTAFVSDNGTALPIGYLESAGEVKEAENYSDVYKVIQDAFVKNGNIIENDPDSTNTQGSPTKTENTPTTEPTDTDINAVVEYGITAEQVEGVAEADILKTDGTNLYYVANNSLYVVSTNNGKMTLLSKIAVANNYPVEMYIDQNKLTVISNNVVETPYETKPSETTTKAAGTEAGTVTTVVSATGSSTTAKTSDTSAAASETTGSTSTKGTSPSSTETTIPSTILQSNAVVEIYDITDKTAPKLMTTYKQSGNYISSRMIESSLYLVTDYSKYQTKPLENKDDLDNYVPAYYINDVKAYIDAKDISIPTQVNSTGYAIVSGLNVQDENPLASIKAVLGDVKNIYCSASNLYLVGNLASMNEKDSSSITRFTINKGSVAYSANVSVEGKIVNQLSMDEYSSSFRIATTTTDAKTAKHYSNIFVLGTDLKPLGSITNLCADKTVKTVSFSKDTAYIVTNEDEDPVTITLADKANLKQVTDKSTSSYSSYLHKYSENRLIGLGNELDKKGNQIGLKLSMFDSSNASDIKEISSISLDGNISDAFLDEVIYRKALLIDSTNNIIGIPTVGQGEYGYKNLYYVITYDETKGFVQKGFLEYNDVEQNFEFNRALFSGDVFYALSNGRIVSAQLSDLKVIEALLLK